MSVAPVATAADRATIEAQWTRLADGATIDEPLGPSPRGERFGTLTDRLGIRWYATIAAEG